MPKRSEDRVQYYANTAYTVPIGAVDQELDIKSALQTAGRRTGTGTAEYLDLITNVDITFKLNSTGSTALNLTSTDGFTLPAGAMAVDKIYFSHTGASSGSGDATLTIFAC